MQNPLSLVLERIRPQANRISLAKGWSRMFGTQGFVEFLKASFKFGAVGAVAFITLRAQQDQLVNAMLAEPVTLPEHIVAIAVRLLGAAAVATILLMAADLVWSRVHWRQNLRMTRQEIKDEHRQSDGDPLVKARQRSLARDRTAQSHDRRGAKGELRGRQPDALRRRAALYPREGRRPGGGGQGQGPDRPQDPRRSPRSTASR